MREAALAYHSTRKWSKQKILTEYLNSVYFGNGAYGVEPAARTYFAATQRPGAAAAGDADVRVTGLPRCRRRLIAGMVASPSGYDPLEHPRAAKRRRNLVLREHGPAALHQRASTTSSTATSAMPTASTVKPPREKSAGAVLRRLDPPAGHRPLRRPAGARGRPEDPHDDRPDAAAGRPAGHPGRICSGIGPSAVARGHRQQDRRGARDGRAARRPTTTLDAVQPATQGAAPARFVVQAVRAGRGARARASRPTPTWASKKKNFTVPNTRGKERFIVNNYDDAYAGTSTLARALTYSDNSVFAEVGIKVGTKKIARLARADGHPHAGLDTTTRSRSVGSSRASLRWTWPTRTRRSPRGGKRDHAARWARPSAGRSGSRRSTAPTARRSTRNRREQRRRALRRRRRRTTTSIMQTVVSDGHRARTPQLDGFAAGKTGTTENYGDAWFIGFDTAATRWPCGSATRTGSSR